MRSPDDADAPPAVDDLDDAEAAQAADPRATEAWLARARARMVEAQVAARGVRDARVLDALRAVPRHRFVPAPLWAAAYDDCPQSIGEGQTISQPYIVGLMTEEARVDEGSKVLEVGFGSGYQAAVLAHLGADVFSIEARPALAAQGVETLRALGMDDVRVRVGDGSLGWPEEAPFDAIIVTCAAREVPPALIEQLAVGGRLVIPIGPPDGAQTLWRLERDPTGALRREDLGGVRFVPMVHALEA